jgi:uncharacterized protein (TIGR00369 family)
VLPICPVYTVDAASSPRLPCGGPIRIISPTLGEVMKEVAKYSKCFVCGDKNEIGLQVKFYADETHAVGEYVAQEQFQGYHGILHGGITASLLDEIMIKAVYALDVVAVTAEMTVRYKKPVYTGERLTLTGKVVEKRGRFFSTTGEARRADGEIVATATGKYLQVSGEFRAELEKSLDPC